MPASLARRVLDTLAAADRRYRDRQAIRAIDSDRLRDLGIDSYRDLSRRMR